MHTEELQQAIEDITTVAEKMGLDFYPMRYELCPADVIHMIGAYGMPSRFSHWRFGKRFFKMSMQQQLGLGKIYELVVNTNPCRAFLLESNTLIQQKMIVAHVLAHADFFKNNAYFEQIDTRMEHTMSTSAARIQAVAEEVGLKNVETFLDAVLSIEEHIDPYQKGGHKQKTTDSPPKDLLLFLQKNSPVLTDWQRELIGAVRAEMRYFWPQIETKIMNEGWATYWHQRIMRALPLTSRELVEYAKLNANIIQPSHASLNPYRLGLKLFESVEQQKGREALFFIRETENDVSFLRNYLTKDIVEAEELYVYETKGNTRHVTTGNWKKVRDELVEARINGGFPVLHVTRADKELMITHRFEGKEIDIRYLEKTLPHIRQLWGEDVCFQTVIDKRLTMFTQTGQSIKRADLGMFKEAAELGT